MLFFESTVFNEQKLAYYDDGDELNKDYDCRLQIAYVDSPGNLIPKMRKNLKK